MNTCLDGRLHPSETVNPHSKGHFIQKKIPPKKTNVFYLTVYIFVYSNSAISFSFISMKCLKNGREWFLLNGTLVSDGIVLYLCFC